MRKLIKLKKNNNLLYNGKLTEYLAPEYVYLPIYKNFKLLVKKNENISMGQIVMENNLNKVLCPVSGIVIGLETKIVDKEEIKCLVIQNDYKEKAKNIVRRKEQKLDKEIIISKLYEYYFKYIASVFETRKLNHLIISGIDDEPYILNGEYILQNYYKEILEMADILTEHLKIKDTKIVLKNSDTKNIETYLSNIRMYPNLAINLIEDKYFLGKSFFLLEHLGFNEMDSLVIDAKTLLEMYFAIKYNKFSHETFVTIAGPMVEKSQIVKVKIGTSFKELIDNEFKLKKGDKEYILNGLMTGESIDIDNAIVTKKAQGIIVILKENYCENKCVNCGLCYKICPVKVNPKKVLDTKMISKNCIDCGLCSYICPSHINLRKYLRGEHE